MGKKADRVVRYANPNGGRLHFASIEGDNLIFVDRKRQFVVERAVERMSELSKGEACTQRSAKR